MGVWINEQEEAEKIDGLSIQENYNRLKEEFDHERFQELTDAILNVGLSGRHIEDTNIYSWQSTKKMEAIVKLQLAQQLISEVRNMFG